MDEKRKPVKKLKIWPLSCAIWSNEHEGRIFYSATFQRSYKDDNGNYQNTDSIGRDDLLSLAKLADAAHTHILRLENEDRKRAARQLSGGRRPPEDGPDAEDDVPF